MPQHPPLRAARAADLPPLAEAIRDATVALDGIRHDARAGTVRIPFSRQLPRKVDGELTLRGARSVATEGRLQQTVDFARDLRFDGSARRLVLECVVVRISVETDAPDAEVRTRSPEEAPRLSDADLPEAFRREVDATLTEQLQRREGWSRRDRLRHVTLSVLGGVVALLLALLFREPWWAAPLAVAAGAGAGFTIARQGWDYAGAGAAAFGLPQMAFSCTGGVVREMVESGGLGGLLVFPVWLLAIVFGGILARLNGRLLETQDVETPYGKPPPLPPMPEGLPRRAAAWCAGGSALVCFVLGGSIPVWAAVAPLVSGGAAWLVASRRAPPRTGGMVFGAIGLLLGACCLGSGRAILPGAFLVAAAHWVGGMLVVFHARGEGARRTSGG